MNMKKFDSCEAGSLPAESSLAPEKLSIKCEVQLDEEKGNSRLPEGCNEAEMSDFGRAAFNQCTFKSSKHFKL